MNRIRFLRLKNGLKQEDFAKILQVSQSSLSGYENGRYEPDCKTLLKISSYFRVSTDYLLGRDPEEILKSESRVRIPVYRKIGSDLGKKASSILFYEDISCPKAPGSEYFALIVNNDHMEPRILPGDLVIACKNDTAPSGSIAVIQIGNENAIICKIIKPDCGGILFIPSNSKHEPVFFSEQQISSIPVRILGIAEAFRAKC